MRRDRTRELFPGTKAPRQMKQPKKDVFRWRAELAEARLAYVSTPLWWRLWHRLAARIRKESEA